MNYDILFFINSILLGAALAMDAFSVSIANGLANPGMSLTKRNLVAGTYAFFQFLMPFIGYICVHTVIEYFNALRRFTPVIALVLLLFIGIKMITEAVQKPAKEDAATGAPESDAGSVSADGTSAAASSAGELTVKLLMVQGIATSIDALSVGFTFAEYTVTVTLVASLIIGIVTFVICMIGLSIGKYIGMRHSDKAQIIGGIILIAIGLEIFIRGTLM